jgi:hypothetical protein
MAFDEAQKVKIRLFLGFPDVFQDGNPRLESAFDVIGARPDTQAEIETILTNLAAADAKVNSVLTHAGIKKVDEVEFFGSKAGTNAVDDARAYGRMWANRLSIVFGIPLVNDVFSERGYGGDAWGDHSFQGSSGGVIPLG